MAVLIPLHFKIYPASDRELKNLLDSFGITPETFMCAQWIVRELLLDKRDQYGGFQIETFGENSKYDPVRAKTASGKVSNDLDFLKFMIEDIRNCNSIPWAFNFRSKNQQPIKFGMGAMIETKGEYIDQLRENFNLYLTQLETLATPSKDGFKWILNSTKVAHKNEIIEQLINSAQGDKFYRKPRESLMLVFEQDTQEFVYTPSNHPYYHEWVVYNYSVWSLLFNQYRDNKRKNHEEDTKKFITQKILWEHTTFEAKDDENHNSAKEAERIKMLKEHFNYEAINYIVGKKGSTRPFIRSVFNHPVMNPTIFAYLFQTLEPISDYSKPLNLNPELLKVAKGLIDRRKNLK